MCGRPCIFNKVRAVVVVRGGMHNNEERKFRKRIVGVQWHARTYISLRVLCVERVHFRRDEESQLTACSGGEWDPKLVVALLAQSR